MITFDGSIKPRPLSITIVLALIFLYAQSKEMSYADQINSSPESTKSLPQKECNSLRIKEIGVFTGIASGNLKGEEDYMFVPIIYRFGFDLTPLFKNSDFKSIQMAEFQVEPFVSAVFSPNNNAEAGCNLLFKYGYPMTKKLCAYFEGGAGVIYITQHTKEQSTQFNFIPQAGAGISYFFKDEIAVNLGYRYRHLSNSSLRHPNKGIEADMFLVGMSFFR